MTILITGAMGNIGQRLMPALPNTMGIDRREGTDFTCDLVSANLQHGPVAAALKGTETLVHLATSADPEAHEQLHFDAIVASTRLVQAAAMFGVQRLVLASSDWAQPKNGMRLNAYAHAKRVMENLADMYNLMPGRKAVALRIGWVPHDISALNGAPDWLIANYWDDDRLIREINTALIA